MGTYDFNKVMSAYAHDNLTVEQAMGYSLQHVGKLYDAQAAASVSRAELRNDINELITKFATLQAHVDRLTVLVTKS